ncbi:Alpha-ketoglutarate-dependent dioxygenase alkB like 4 [Dissostichus eleginoides]|uniref:Alpha-ketoglutarate-dependent dioxygenase alkB like 4 n=1 Tax=Dissostichus eleginoides TaxID=100907 RepID=A0AAD9BE84_DISEL|nr:Alpha-ketoglutarate-dependent dioxygenase alkB like 4 [Dissostichus eleginoides]
MQDEGSASCACKGIRRCLKCENVKGKEQLKANEPKAVHQFLYDPETRLAVPRDADSSCFSFPGVFLQEDFISEEEEEELIRTIDGDVWNDSQSGRRKQDFGPKVNFKKQKVRLSSFSGLPAVSRSLVLRMQSEASLEDFRPWSSATWNTFPSEGPPSTPPGRQLAVGGRLVTVNMLGSPGLRASSSEVVVGVVRRGETPMETLDPTGRYSGSQSVQHLQRAVGGLPVGGAARGDGAKLLDISLSFRGTPV